MKHLAQIIAVLGLLALAGFAGIKGVAHSVALTAPNRALGVDPGQSDALLALAEARRLSGETPVGEVAALGRRLMRRAPLSEAPLVYVGWDLAARNQVDAARDAFRLALARQPRNLPALSWLAADDLRRSDYSSAIGALERLSVLKPDQITFYAEALASMAGDPKGVPLLLAHQAGGTRLAEHVLARLNATSQDASLLLALNARSPRGQADLVQRLNKERGATEAFIAWLEFAPVSETQQIRWPFDPAFVGSKAPAPFNWQIFEDAELLEQGGLFVRYGGRAKPVFVRQLMMLSRGRYTFTADMDGRSSQDGGRFEWVISCDLDGKPLGSTATTALSDVMSSVSFVFDVPDEGCPAQRLELRGRPGEFPVRATGIARRVSIEGGSVVR